MNITLTAHSPRAENRENDSPVSTQVEVASLPCLIPNLV